jgi:hypothetical protein
MKGKDVMDKVNRRTMRNEMVRLGQALGELHRLEGVYGMPLTLPVDALDMGLEDVELQIAQLRVGGSAFVPYEQPSATLGPYIGGRLPDTHAMAKILGKKDPKYVEFVRLVAYGK